MARGGKNVYSKWSSSGNLQFVGDDNVVFHTLDGVNGRTLTPGVLYQIRTRFTIAQVNAGATLLSALSGFKYRMVDCSAISVGGAAGAVTTVDVLGTQSASGVKLVAFAQTSLTQSAELRAGDSGATILADGASYVACDANTAITVGITGSSITTATHIDIIFSYAVDAA